MFLYLFYYLIYDFLINVYIKCKSKQLIRIPVRSYVHLAIDRDLNTLF